VNCLLCSRPPAQDLRLCWRHRDRLADLLDPHQPGTPYNPDRPDDYRVQPSIPVLYAALDASPGSDGPPSAGGGSGVFRSTPPARLEVLALRDRRTRPDEQGGPWSVQGTLLAIGSRLLGLGRVRIETVEQLAAVLHARTDLLAQQDWVTDAWHDLRAVHAQLLAATGDPNPQPVGTCTATVDDDGHEHPDGQWRCAWPLYLAQHAAPRDPDSPPSLAVLPGLRCSSCGHRYTGAELLRLGRAHQAAS